MVQTQITGITSAKNAGVYTAQVVLIYNQSFNVVNDNFDKKLVWEIAPAKIEIDVESKTGKYGDEIQDLNYSVIGGKIYGKDQLDISLGLSGYGVGEHNIVATCSNTNYEIVSPKAKYTITPRHIKVKLLDQEYKLNRFKGVKQDKFEILPDGDSVVRGDNLNISISSTVGNNLVIGTYSLLAYYNNPNYVIEFISANLILLKPDTPFTIISTIVIAGLVIAIVVFLVWLGISRYRQYDWKRKIEY